MSFKPVSNVVEVNATSSSTIFNSEYVFICNPDNSVKQFSLPGTGTGNIILRNNLCITIDKPRGTNITSNGVLFCTALAV